MQSNSKPIDLIPNSSPTILSNSLVPSVKPAGVVALTQVLQACYQVVSFRKLFTVNTGNIPKKQCSFSMPCHCQVNLINLIQISPLQPPPLHYLLLSSSSTRALTLQLQLLGNLFASEQLLDIVLFLINLLLKSSTTNFVSRFSSLGP